MSELYSCLPFLAQVLFLLKSAKFEPRRKRAARREIGAVPAFGATRHAAPNVLSRDDCRAFKYMSYLFIWVVKYLETK